MIKKCSENGCYFHKVYRFLWCASSHTKKHVKYSMRRKYLGQNDNKKKDKNIFETFQLRIGWNHTKNVILKTLSDSQV
jgi:hypothetical protein